MKDFGPTCGKCGKLMTPTNARLRPELHDDCLPAEFKPSLNNDNRWIQTFTGKKFWPLSPRPEDVCIEDIAHALAMKCRFGGHIRAFYSVAQHSVLVSLNVPDKDARWGLLHDAAEAYLPDVCRPIKKDLRGFADLEFGVMQAVSEAFGLEWPEPSSIKTADLILLETERRDLVGNPRHAWTETLDITPLAKRIEARSWQASETDFLARFKELFRQ